MPPRRRARAKRPIESYDHRDKERLNNPPVGLVTPQTDTDAGQQTYKYDPHLDPQLSWAGKAEHVSFEVPTVSLHVHERIEPRTIIEAVRKRNGAADAEQLSFFELPEENPPLRQAIEFYGHSHNWSNRLIAGDSLLVMNSLLQKENLAGKVQMVYLDPPYGIRYGSNFQPFVNKRDVRDGRDDDLTAEPEQIRAFRDTWELGIHSYLTYLRDRLLLARELLTESGSVFVQISDENLHHVRELMDEVFGVENFRSLITFTKTRPLGASGMPGICDYVIWYAKNTAHCKFHPLFMDKTPGEGNYSYVQLPTGERRRLNKEERQEVGILPHGSKIFQCEKLASSGYTPTCFFDIEFEGNTYPPKRTSWRTNRGGVGKLINAHRLHSISDNLYYVSYFEDNPVQSTPNVWNDTRGEMNPIYAVQTTTKTVQRCLLMTTDPGDLVFDPTCGSGTTAYVAEQWGRRWITCDTSRVALTLVKQRLMTASFDYYELAHPAEGVGSGFTYKTVPHITLRSIANNPDIREGMTRVEIDAAIAQHAPQETLYDQPVVDRRKQRVSGPFSVEAVPAPTVAPLEEFLVGEDDGAAALTPALSQGERDSSVARSGETVRQSDWRDELLKTGIRGKAGQYIHFARLEPLPGCRYLHADGETLPNDRGADSIREGGAARTVQRVVVSFGPDHAPLEQRQVEPALEEAQTLFPRPKVVVFAAFQFDSEAAKDIDETNWPGMTLLKAQMNADLLTDDLKRKRASNESFWLVGQPDVEVSSFEFLVSRGGESRIADYERFKKLSGLDRVAEINRLGWHDLCFYALVSQGRAVWDYLADQAGWDFHTGQYRGGTGQKHRRGVPPVSWDSTRLVSGVGDLAGDLGEFGVSDLGTFRRAVEHMRRDRQIVGGLEALAHTLSFPIAPHTKNHQLETKNLYRVAVQGFDYYNTKSGDVESGGKDKIAVWLLDTDYDGRSLYPRQVFFPMAGSREGWARLARNLKAEIDEDLIEAYRGPVSLPFEAGEHRRIAVKIVDDRGIESLKVLELD